MDVRRVAFCIFSIYNNILLHLAEWNCLKDDPQKWTTRKAKTIICISFISYLPFYLSCIASFLNLFPKNLCLFGAFWNISTRQMFCLSNCENQWQTAQRSLDNVNFSEHNVFLSFSAMCSLAGASCVFWIVLPLQLQNQNPYNLSLIPNLCKFKSLPQTLP